MLPPEWKTSLHLKRSGSLWGHQRELWRNFCRLPTPRSFILTHGRGTAGIESIVCFAFANSKPSLYQECSLSGIS
jgi:hypothetical protein